MLIVKVKKSDALDETFLQQIYQINPQVTFTIKDGQVTIEKKQNHWTQRLFRKLYVKIPETSYITLDPYGSFIFQAIDGKKDIEELGKLLSNKFEEADAYLYDRLTLYLHYLEIEEKWIYSVN